MVQVVWRENVLIFIEGLAFKLYKKKYFSYIDVANKYVAYIYNYVNENISFLKHNQTKPQHKKYGAYYIIIITNKRTAWHVYFDKKDNKYIINKLLNNHLPTAKFLNEL